MFKLSYLILAVVYCLFDSSNVIRSQKQCKVLTDCISNDINFQNSKGKHMSYFDFINSTLYQAYCRVIQAQTECIRKKLPTCKSNDDGFVVTLRNNRSQYLCSEAGKAVIKELFPRSCNVSKAQDKVIAQTEVCDQNLIQLKYITASEEREDINTILYALECKYMRYIDDWVTCNSNVSEICDDSYLAIIRGIHWTYMQPYPDCF